MGSFDLGGFGPWQWLEIVEHELLLFAAVFFALGAIDEFLLDLAWLRLRLTGRARAERFEGDPRAPLAGSAAVLVPAWREADVVSAMLAHALASWPQRELRIYAGCYRNDPATLAALIAGVECDPRVRIVVHDADGPTTKADCLNRLYAALVADERRSGARARSVILHDAEDMVHPAALALIDAALSHADFVQLPVLPVPQPRSRWIAGHYGDEFAEAHGKNLVVRDSLAVGIPAAGVGCGFARAALERVARARGRGGDEAPFAAECLTEDYELGLLIGASGGTSRFVRSRDADGGLIATRELFPAELGAAVRQKTRWLHGIAFQGWDRLGWAGQGRMGRPAELWMRLRDRRGPLTAIVLAAAYLVIVVWGALFVAERAGWHEPRPLGGVLVALLWFNFASFVWRAWVRFAFSARTYGAAEGLRALLRIPIANVIAIMAGRRAILAYVRSLLGGRVRWEKTEHRQHATALLGNAPQPRGVAA
ncbi:MAG TPA: glycosyl transferase family protein [Novosphingobium sp.]|nr:glycosyl transferase family protein [Novosphingobium sp.]